ncbi:MAG: hypothetical protein GX929_01840 [Clostridiales bacterium]|jgi:hypothetical protein|nr:hypothetical protein [Clostridiales bacterium]
MRRIAARLLALLLTAALLTGMTAAYERYEPRYGAEARTLWRMGLLLGNGRSFALDRPLTRAQGAVMLTRLLGMGGRVTAEEYPQPFVDVSADYAPYVGYCYNQGFMTGISETRCGADEPMTAVQYVTLTLRALGYDSDNGDGSGDFRWDASLDFARKIGLIDHTYRAYLLEHPFLRDDVVHISYRALNTRMKGSDTVLSDAVEMPGSPGGAMPELVDPKPKAPNLYTRAAVGDDYFSDAVFIGDSMLTAFKAYTGLKTPDYFAAISMNIFGVSKKQVIEQSDGSKITILDALAKKTYGKVYLALGLNEIGYAPDYFAARYKELVAKIRELQPDADIYLMSLPPVGRYVSSYADLYTLKRVTLYNETIYGVTRDTGCYYLDIYSALADEEGYLPSDASRDGIHFGKAYYIKWLEYLKTHYA